MQFEISPPIESKMAEIQTNRGPAEIQAYGTQQGKVARVLNYLLLGYKSMSQFQNITIDLKYIYTLFL